MVMQFGENEEFEDVHPDDLMDMCICMDYDGSGGDMKSGGYGNNMPSLGAPPVISCYLLIRFLDDALNMMRSLQYVTVGLMSKLDDMVDDFPFDDLYEKLRWHANCYHEWQEADSSKFQESQQAVIDSAKSLCFFFLEVRTPKNNMIYTSLHHKIKMHSSSSADSLATVSCPLTVVAPSSASIMFIVLASAAIMQ